MDVRAADDDPHLAQLKSRLQSIDCSGAAIESLSRLLRNAEPWQRKSYLTAWLDVFKLTTPERLQALLYVANDVIQKLGRTSSDSIKYKYNFALVLAEGLPGLHLRQPRIMSETFRIIEIWRSREVLDSKTLDLLDSAAQGHNVREVLQDHVLGVVIRESAQNPRDTLKPSAIGNSSSSSARNASGLSGGSSRGVKADAIDAREELDEDVDCADLVFAKRMRTLITSLIRLRRSLREKHHFILKLRRGSSSAATPVVADAEEAARFGKLEVLNRKVWRLRVELSHLISEIYVSLDSRHALLAQRLEVMAKSYRLMVLEIDDR
eukprot:Lankesteria_metandrocarpae@DN4058_c0_g1_i1.p1